MQKSVKTEILKVKRYTNYNMGILSDNIACLAANIEDAYRLAGIDDYTGNQCVEIALKEVLPKWIDDKYVGGINMHIDTTQHPSD